MYIKPQHNRHSRRSFFNWFRLGRNFDRKRNGFVVPYFMHNIRSKYHYRKIAKDRLWLYTFEQWFKIDNAL